MAYDSSKNLSQRVFLLGAIGTPSTGNGEGDPFGRSRFVNHLVQRIKLSGVDPVVLIQVNTLSPTDDPTTFAAGWSTIATLNNATPHVVLANHYLPYIRAVRSDSVAGNLLVVCASQSVFDN